MYKLYYNKTTNAVVEARQMTQDEPILINETKLFAKATEWVLKNGDTVQILSDSAFKLNFILTEKKILLD